MKLKLFMAAGLAASGILVSCAGDDSKNYTDKSIVPTAEEKAALDKAAAEKAALNPVIPNQTVMPGSVLPAQNTVPVNLPITTQQQPQSININPQNNTVVSAPQTITQTPVPTVTQPGMNPPHGQPNHRCDITVGAPLNSKPAAPATAQPTTVSTAPQQVTMKEVPNTQKTLPGMNPPHGEPNHRCDIAVGAPLNSKPAPSTVTTTNVPATIAPPALLTPAKTDSSKN